jgi:allophanate hydrolase subunit 1
MSLRIEIAGQDAFIVYFADQAGPQVSSQIQSAVSNIRSTMSEFIVDLVPSYASLLVIYDLNKTDPFEVRSRLRQAVSSLDGDTDTGGNLVTLPVYYSEESGPD